jgi:hypothetical protein
MCSFCKEQRCNVIGGKTLYINFGEKCIEPHYGRFLAKSSGHPEGDHMHQE